ncbi:hypothetical protein ASZ90_013495 [hydrocarbon metagenome]|uniref:Uncharacterized protein n=1 Tax=hydrocarbon metagenome TaxID=938273 RepID=A0A0W8F7W0_9ZZZZ
MRKLHFSKGRNAALPLHASGMEGCLPLDLLTCLLYGKR